MIILNKILNDKNNTLYFINDRNQNIRWAFPDTLQFPTFLNLYNTNTVKGYVYKLLVKLIFNFHLQKYFVSGSMNGGLNEKYQSIIQKLNCTNYSIFTGTAGENRKIVIETNAGSYTKYFIKIPVTISASELVQKEKENLEYMNTFEFNSFTVPKIAYSDNETVAISNIKPNEKVLNTTKLFDVHLECLNEIYAKTTQRVIFEETKYFHETQNYLKSLETKIENDIDSFVIKKIYSNLCSLNNLINSKYIVHFSFAHCDFTPWNMYVTKTKLFVYDWEMGRRDAPLLFDFFHYIFQSEVLINHHNFNEIKLEIKKLLENQLIKNILSAYKVDVNIYYSLYLMYNVSYYVSRYIKQTDLHVQAYWLIDVWNDALEDFIQNKGKTFDS